MNTVAWYEDNTRVCMLLVERDILLQSAAAAVALNFLSCLCDHIICMCSHIVLILSNASLIMSSYVRE